MIALMLKAFRNCPWGGRARHAVWLVALCTLGPSSCTASSRTGSALAGQRNGIIFSGRRLLSRVHSPARDSDTQRAANSTIPSTWAQVLATF